MSWDAYVTQLMAPNADQTPVVSEAAICGIDDLTVWAASKGYKCISAEEIKTLAGPRDNFSSCGPRVAGIKTMLLVDNMDEDEVLSLNLKTVSDAEGNKYNLCVGKSCKTLVLARGVVGDVGGELSTRVFTIVKYLKATSF